jgi:peptidoglycan/xylan/chitin deacetylase (PgdA/CDA1 family)
MKVTWIKQLLEKRKQKVFIQTFRMFKFHRTPFSTLLGNIFDVLERYEAKFTFPIGGSVALKNPELVQTIFRSGHEVAIHGFKHVMYTYLSEHHQETDIKRAIDAFKKLSIPICGFRAPYNVYTEHTIKLIEKYGFLWDGGIGYNPKYRTLANFFKIRVNNHLSSFICIPLNIWSDDRMVDQYGFESHQIGKILKSVIKWINEKRGVVMFDLHPIRIGQRRYIDGLKQALDYGTKLNGWFPTVTEAVREWRKNKRWKHNADFCCLLTGDIDNFTFFDYLKRLV